MEEGWRIEEDQCLLSNVLVMVEEFPSGLRVAEGLLESNNAQWQQNRRENQVKDNETAQ